MLPFNKILITGGTGSFGKCLLKTLIDSHPEITRIVIFSRDELKQWELQQSYPQSKYPHIRFFVGDIRDSERLLYAMDGIEAVVHAAALKQVETAEYNPGEFIRTNVLGSENVINACLKTNVKYAIALSTDKASAPINLYGATKLCADKLFTAANNIKGNRNLILSVVRYGNVMGSRGSVIPFFVDRKKNGLDLPITDKSMTRFNILVEEGVKFVLDSICSSKGGEIHVPKIPSYRITDLAMAIDPDGKNPIIGIRPGEKLHEQMISTDDSYYTFELANKYIIAPPGSPAYLYYTKQQASCNNFKKVPEGFEYTSRDNNHFLSIEELKMLLSKTGFLNSNE
ncbi:UDP-N-acetylglucosamine 4,6-dehydratase (inverting) [bacterium]|nr:UDP-N-acetylglucosamine 4,6-dehydratase (inverting) [bacterium]